MNSAEELVVAALVGAGGLAGAKLLHHLFNRDARRRRRARKTEVTRIADAESGLVRVIGVIAASDGLLRLPYSGIPGVAHHSRLVIWGAELRWIGTAAAQPFFVDDGSGRALVQVDRGSQIDFIEPDPADEPVGLDSADIQAIMARGKENWGHAVARNLTYTYRQIRISPGDRIELFGDATREPPATLDPRDLAGSYREPPKQLVIRPLDGKVTIKRK
jgi:hypothetical protein